jgi:xanthine dehydrogenase YagS FAD-binding subunit
MNVSQAEIRAGGTDLSERRRSGVSRGEIVDLVPTAETTEIAWNENGAARIGALVSIANIAADARLRQSYPGLVAAAAGLATPQIRAIATLGGNLAQRTRCWYYRNRIYTALRKAPADVRPGMAITSMASPSTWVRASRRTPRPWAPHCWPTMAWSKPIDAVIF